jgi:hypothetical protein
MILENGIVHATMIPRISSSAGLHSFWPTSQTWATVSLWATADLPFYGSSSSDCCLLKMPKPFVHCSLTYCVIHVGFPNHVIRLYENLSQSYTKLNFCLLFNLQHPSVQSSNINKIQQTKQTLTPFMFCLYTNSACLLEWISDHAFPTYLWILGHGNSHRSLKFTNVEQTYEHTQKNSCNFIGLVRPLFSILLILLIRVSLFFVCLGSVPFICNSEFF